MKNKIENIIDDALLSFYLDADKETIEASLIDNKLNNEEYARKKKRIIFLAKAAANKSQNDYLLQLANRFQEAVQANVERPIALLKQLIQDNPSFAFYRNLDKLSKEDIMEIIKDKNLVDLLEQLEQDENKK